MGCHVSVAPNQQTHRNTSLKTRGETALFGVFGYELDLNILTEEEKEEVRQQIRFVKEHRKLIMTGNFYRLISPFEAMKLPGLWFPRTERKLWPVITASVSRQTAVIRDFGFQDWIRRRNIRYRVLGEAFMATN